MARPPSTHPTDRELEILAYLWDHGPAGLGDIRHALTESSGGSRGRVKGKPPAATTVATMLQIMLDKKLVRRASKSASGAKSAYQWSAAVSRQVAARGLIGKLVDRVFDGSARGLVAHLIEDGRLSDDEIAGLKMLLQQERSKTSMGKEG